MTLRLFNTLTGQIDPLTPSDGATLRMYACGPTVYDYGHIGNFRTFLQVDVLRRFLELTGIRVRHVMNVTDVDDKIIRNATAAKLPIGEYTKRFEQAFFEDLEALRVEPPEIIARATEHIPRMVELVQKLAAAGAAYQTEDGSWYFRLAAFPAYGKLSKKDLSGMEDGARVDLDEYEKDSARDFALWKAAKPGETFWDTAIGRGRPGWHIECSAMAMEYLGESFDLHCGGEDLMFPHHEDEIAQSEGAGVQLPGKHFVKYWLHGAFLLVEGKKMSKSLGNFFTLRDLLARGFTGREIRFLLLQSHYRETFNFTLDGLQGARVSLTRIDECLNKLRELAGNTKADADSALLARFYKALDEDLNVAGAWGVVFDWVRDTNRRLAESSLAPAAAASALAAWERLDSVLGVGAPAGVTVPVEISAMVEARQAARKAKDFKRADALRDELKAKGWVIEDTAKGARAKRL